MLSVIMLFIPVRVVPLKSIIPDEEFMVKSPEVVLNVFPIMVKLEFWTEDPIVPFHRTIALLVLLGGPVIPLFPPARIGPDNIFHSSSYVSAYKNIDCPLGNISEKTKSGLCIVKVAEPTLFITIMKPFIVGIILGIVRVDGKIIFA